MRPLLLIGVVVFFLSGTVFALPSCPASQQSIFKTVTGDLKGNGTLLRVRFQQCRMDESNSAGEYRNGFVIVAKDGSVLADVLAPDPTTMRVLYSSQPLDRLWSAPGGAIITFLVKHGARTMDLYAYRFRHGHVPQIGFWKGGAEFEVAWLGARHRLTVIAGQPDRSRLPQISVWERERFRPADERDTDIFRAIGERVARPIFRGAPLPPESFVDDCSVALQAFARAGDLERGRHVCHFALRRLEQQQDVVPEFPGQNSRYFAELVTWAQRKIRQILTEPAELSAADDASDPHAHTVIESRNTGHLTDMPDPQIVEWYRRGPLSPEAPHNPPRYIRGIVVRSAGPHTRPLARWEAHATTIAAFYSRLNRIWPIAKGHAGSLVSLAVQYGGRLMSLRMFAFDGRALRQAGTWGGEDMTIVRMKSHLVVVVHPSDYYRVPDLYAWNGTGFALANPEFPAFYAKLGRWYATGISAHRSLPPEAIVAICRLTLQANRLARREAEGRALCVEGRRRLVTGERITPGNAPRSAAEFAAAKEQAIAAIDALLRPPTNNPQRRKPR